jgi:POT family proton-dependent oligopeptide transporter
MTDKIHLKQPLVFRLAFSTAMFERFAFYVLTFLLVLFAKEVYDLSDIQAFTLVGIFNGLVFLTPAIGGYLADNIFGIRRCLILGMFLEATGLILLFFQAKILFWLSLSLVIIGVGLFKTAPTNLLGRSYQENDPRIDSGFTLFYMAMNIGGFFAPIAGGILQRYYGWHFPFLIAGIALYVGILCYFLFRKSARIHESVPGRRRLPITTWLALIFGLIISIACCIFLLIHNITADVFFIAAAIGFISYFIFEITRSTKEDKYRIIACLLLILIGMIFFILYFQLFTSVTLFIKRTVVNTILGINIPPIVFLSLEAFWVVILGPILAMIYNFLRKHHRDLAVTSKFTIGLLIISLCFFILKISTLTVIGEAKVNPLWIIFMFFVFALGDLLVGALGVAMVTRIAPKRMYGVMMGSWFLIASTLGAAISGLLAGIANVPQTVHDTHAIISIYGAAFFHIGLIGLSITIIIFFINPYIKRMAKFG